MSQAADAWLAIPEAKRLYGDGQLGGIPHLCVKHVPCLHCKAKPGQLCRGHAGPTLRHHVPRGRSFLAFKRSHPGEYPAARLHRLKRLEERVSQVERLLGHLQDALGRVQPKPQFPRSDNE